MRLASVGGQFLRMVCHNREGNRYVYGFLRMIIILATLVVRYWRSFRDGLIGDLPHASPTSLFPL